MFMRVAGEWIICVACGVKQWCYGVEPAAFGGKFKGKDVKVGDYVCIDHKQFFTDPQARLDALTKARAVRAATKAEVERLSPPGQNSKITVRSTRKTRAKKSGAKHRARGAVPAASTERAAVGVDGGQPD